MRSLLLSAILAGSALAQPGSVTSVAGATFHAGDLAKAREFYTKVFGLTERPGGGTATVAFQLSRDQFLEFAAGEATEPLQRIVFRTNRPMPAIRDQDGHALEFVQSAAATDFTPPASNLSTHLLHVGMGVSDMNRAIEFYSGHFGFKEIFRRPDNKVLIMRVPGASEDWVEFILRGEQGSDHICLEVPDIQRAYKALIERGATLRGKPRIASNGYWVINMADPNGVRVELMEPKPAK